MNVLIVGAGAVGQVYGHALAQAGARVHFLVRPRYLEAARRGFVLYPFHHKGGAAPQRFTDFTVHSTLDELRAHRFDALIPAVSGPALHQPWLPDTLAAAEGAALVLLHAGMTGATDLFDTLAPDRRRAWGMIPFMAFAAPLPGQSLPEPGTGWWLPPLARTGFDGDREITAPLTRLLTAGGLPAAVQPGVARQGAFGTAFLSCHMAALQAGGWRFDGLRPLLPLAAQATRQAAGVVAALTGWKAPLPVRLMHPCVGRAALPIVEAVTPFSAEAFFAAHFTKVNHQTQEHLTTWVAEGEARCLPVQHLADLSRRAWPPT